MTEKIGSRNRPVRETPADQNGQPASVCEESSTDIINEYIVFCKVYGEQLKKFKRTRKAITDHLHP